MQRNRGTEKGFTLMELLVVISIIAILTALLLPTLAYGKFRGRVSTCTNNYRQFALAAALYANEDSKERLPSFQLPTESTQLLNFHNLYPWLIGLPMLKTMETHGMTTPRMWYCPLRKRWEDATATFQWKFGRPMATIEDFSRYFTEIQESKYAFVDLNWWVPRRLEGSPTLTYPDVSLLPTRLKTPWPSRLDDVSTSTRPIVSDWMNGEKALSGDSFGRASGAHAFAGRIRNANSGYADGHVESHSATRIKWELRLTEGDNSYIFY